jgi:allantoate deiminase
MSLRRDALAAAVEWMAEVERMARSTNGLVATVGKIATEPNAANVIPGRVTLSLDVRHISDEARSGSLAELRKIAGEISARRGIEIECTEKMNQPSVHLDDLLTARLLHAVEGAGFPAKRMVSGAGHDAMVMAARVPTTMLFLRSPGGISHHPAEAVLEEDVEAALRVGEKFLEQLATEVG